MSDDLLMNLFRAMGATITSDAEYAVPGPEEMTVKGSVFVRYHPDVPSGNMTKVIVPNGVKTIGKGAFIGPDESHNYYLECCRLPEGVAVIKSQAFALCAGMRSIELPKSLKKIESEAFMFSGLKSIELPDGLETIGDGAFEFCRSIRELRIPPTVTKIGIQCFLQTGVPLMDTDAPGAKIKAPSYLKELYDQEDLDKLFEQHEVEWYSAKMPKGDDKTVDSGDYDYSCLITVHGNGTGTVSYGEGSKETPPIYIYQLARILSLADETGLPKHQTAEFLADLADADDDEAADLFECENPNSTLSVGVAVNENGESFISVTEEKDCSGGEVLLVFRIGIIALKTMLELVMSPDSAGEVVKNIILLYFSSEDYDDFVSNISPSIPDSWYYSAMFPTAKPKKKKSAKRKPPEKKPVADTGDISDVSRSYFSKFKAIDVPKSRRKLFDKYAPRLQEERPLGCDLRIEQLTRDNPRSNTLKAYLAYHGVLQFIDRAKQFAQVFCVPAEEFDPKSDRYAEIFAGYIKHISTMHALKSFVQVIYDYARKVKKKLYEINMEEVQAAADFIDAQGGTNFNYCNGMNMNYWTVSLRIIEEVGYEYTVDDQQSIQYTLFAQLAYDLYQLTTSWK